MARTALGVDAVSERPAIRETPTGTEPEDRSRREALEDVRGQLARALRAPWLAGRLVSAELVAGANRVAHGLGATPSGYLQLRLRATAPVTYYESAADRAHLELTSSAAASLTLWVWP